MLRLWKILMSDFLVSKRNISLLFDFSAILVYWLSYNQLKNTKHRYEWETNVGCIRHQEHKCNFESIFHAHVSKNKMICSHYYWRIKMVNLCKRCLPFQNHVPKVHRHQHYIIVCMENCSTFCALHLGLCGAIHGWRKFKV